MGLKNPSNTKSTRRLLRKKMTEAEVVFWSAVRAKQLFGLRVKRQYGFGSYILDFYIPKLQLAFELDGDVHCQLPVLKKDINRDTFLKQNGIKVLRISNEEILQNLDGVLRFLTQIVNEDSIEFLPPLSPPSKGGER